MTMAITRRNSTRGEIMGLLDVYGDGLHQRVIDAILPAFDYLENRLTGQCQAQFDCTHS